MPKPTRRSVLISLAAVPLASACPSSGPVPDPEDPTPRQVTTGGPEPEPWSPDQVFDGTAFPWAVTATDVTSDGVILALQTDEPLLGVRVMEGTGGGWVEVLSEDGLEVTDGFVHVEVTALSADRTYAYVFVTPDGRRSVVGRFRTALGADDWRTLVIGATSCLGSTGRPFPTLSDAASHQLDVFCLLGDTVYADGSTTVEHYRDEYRTTFAQQGFIDVAASTSMVATWDDHEVDNNYDPSSATIQARLPAAKQAFGEALPYRQGPGGSGIWRRLQWGEVLDLFVLDCRSERLDGRYISLEQMQWLQEGLLGSTARFKVVLNSVPITDYTSFFGELFREDRWEGYPQRTELIDFIWTEDIGGIFWISGDFHFGSLGRVDPPGFRGDGMWEALAGPGGSNPIGAVEFFAVDDQVPFFIADWTWLRVEADPMAGTLLVQFIDGEGSVVQERLLEV